MTIGEVMPMPREPYSWKICKKAKNHVWKTKVYISDYKEIWIAAKCTRCGMAAGCKGKWSYQPSWEDFKSDK